MVIAYGVGSLTLNTSKVCNQIKDCWLRMVYATILFKRRPRCWPIQLTWPYVSVLHVLCIRRHVADTGAFLVMHFHSPGGIF